MPVPSFYTTAYEYGLTHPNVEETIATAARLYEDPSGGAHGLGTRILSGVVEREDLNTAQALRVHEVGSPSVLSLRVALLTHPNLRRTPEVQDLFTADMIPYVLAHPTALEFADQILRFAPGRRSPEMGGRTDENYYAVIEQVLGVEVVADYFECAGVSAEFSVRREAARHPLLTDAGFDALLEVINAAPGDDSSVTLYMDLASRQNLSVSQGLALVDAGARVAKADGTGTGRWIYLSLINNAKAPAEVMTKLVKHRARTVRELVLTQGHVTPPTLFAAVRAHVPYALTCLTTGSIPDDIADIALTDLEAGQVRRHTFSAQEVQRFTQAVLNRTSGPQIWDRALNLYLTCGLFEDETAAVEAFFKHAIFADIAGRPWTNTRASHKDMFLSWATIHPHELVRARAVQELIFPAHLAAAATDASALVRTAVIANRYTTEDTLLGLVNDPDENLRVALVEHPAAGVTVMSLMSKDSSEKVRAVVTERFLSAFPAAN